MRFPKGRVVQMVVDEVADEVSCWLPTMSAGRGVWLLRISLPNTLSGHLKTGQR